MSELPYWIAISNLERWKTERKNKLFIDILHNKKLSFVEFFDISKEDLVKEFELNEIEALSIINTKKELPTLSFLAEKLYNNGFEIITINSKEYPKILKDNLKVKFSPPIIYIKGNKSLLKEPTVAVVGSRDAGQRSLDFTDNIVKRFVKEYKVIVSGFAKGVDRQSLDSSLKYDGKSIIVLPQGVLTFGSGIKKYYSGITDGQILVLSTYHPDLPWSVGNAMGRNRYIYGLAEEIYVAETNDSGGTWEGAINGLKNSRKVYILYPNKNDKNANLQLIHKGAIPVDFNGNKFDDKLLSIETQPSPTANMKDSKKPEVSDAIPVEKIYELFIQNKHKAFTAKEINSLLDLNLHTLTLSKKLVKLDFICEAERVKKSDNKKFQLKENDKDLQQKLF